jgi:hypothetical protein
MAVRRIDLLQGALDRAAADAEQESWQRLSKAVTRVLRAIEEGA